MFPVHFQMVLRDLPSHPELLHEDWEKIAVDLEIIQTEGFEATRKVDPNMVIKKKNGKDEEVGMLHIYLQEVSFLNVEKCHQTDCFLPVILSCSPSDPAIYLLNLI